MLHAKFQDRLVVLEKKISKVFTIYGHGGHLGHVKDHLYKLSFPLPKEAPHKIWL